MYEAWRQDGGPTLYPSNRTPVTADILLAGFVYAFAILGLAFIIVVLGFRGKRMRLNAFIIHGELLILSFIIMCNFGQDWEVGGVSNTSVPYKSGVREEIQAEIGLSIGLRSVNITLKTDPDTVQFNGGKTNETINYNERFSWNDMGFTPGRPGFGPNAGLLNKQYREAQLRGTPFPILRVAQYFTLDGGAFRWGRFYRQAGYYAHILLWLAFPLWILTIILFSMVLRSGCYFCMLTGLVLAGANVIYSTIRNPLDLAVPIGAEHVLTVSWGWCFWLNLATACITFLVGALFLIIDLTCHKWLAFRFGIDTEKEAESVYREHHWVSGLGSGGHSSIIQVTPSDHTVYSRPIMSARPGEHGIGPSLRLARQTTKGDDLQRDYALTLIPGQTEDAVSITTADGNGFSLSSTSISSITSGYKSPAPNSTSSGAGTKHKTGRRTRKVSPESQCL